MSRVDLSPQPSPIADSLALRAPSTTSQATPNADIARDIDSDIATVNATNAPPPPAAAALPLPPKGFAAASSGFSPGVRRFLTYIRIECGLASATIEAYTRDLDELVGDLETRGVKHPKEVTASHLIEHVRFLSRQRDLDPSTIVRHVSTVRVFFKFLHASRLIEDNPARLLERPSKWRKVPNVISPSQMKKLVESPTADHGALHVRDRAILELMYAAGIRASEVGSVRLNQWFPTLASLSVIGKGNKQRIVPVGMKAAHALTRWIETQRGDLVKGNEAQADHRLFVSLRGKPLERVAVWMLVKKYALVAGLHGVHPHVLRHSFATDLLRGGCDLRTVQEFLGHASVVTTQIYTHVDKSRMREVVKKFHPRFDE